jgi:uncharacterized membrane protein
MLTSSSRIVNLSIAAAVTLCCVFSQLTAVDGFSSSIAVSNERAGFLISSSGATTTATTRPRTIIADEPKTTATQLFASSTGDIVPGIGEEGCNLPSVSGVNTKDNLAQAFTVKVIFLSLGAGTYLFSSGLHEFSAFLGVSNFESQYQFFRNAWPLAFGAVFSLAGVTHFTLAEEYENIVPTKGAWGVWNIPGSRAFHVAWTGAAELTGGLGLLAGGLSAIFGSSSPLLAPFTSAGLESDSAAALFLLTVAITPANIFMYTHGAKLPMDSESLPLQFHAIRWVMQVVILGFLYQIGEETFQILLS